MTINTERPWIPADADESFDPLVHFETFPDEDTPLVVTPRGGAREVGRSCYQVDTEHGRYLVDCGLNQGEGDSYPDFRGLSVGDVDAVFLTHAHIDHCGGLPVLESKGLLADDAPIIATSATIDITETMLEDSLKIHRRETGPGESQRFTRADVDAIMDRFEAVDYGGGRVESYAAVSDMESLVFNLGNAAHLLGSAWVQLHAGGHSVLFSGDIGDRAKHLPSMTTPPGADLLVTESTYGATHSHRSFKDAEGDVFETVVDAVKNREPVLIPTFAVGRAQLLQLTFAERLRSSLPEDLKGTFRIVVDGMAQEATDIYHDYVDDGTFVAESIVNRVRESGWTEPFHPPTVTQPQSDADRRNILENANPRKGGKVPIIISPSGMLTGGNSPRYLTEFAARFDSAQVLLTGYQALGTTGRELQDYLDAGEEEVTFTTDANPFGTDWPEARNVTWSDVKQDGKYVERTRATVPTDWVTNVGGLSAHAAQYGLLKFARNVSPDRVALVHGPDYAQDHYAKHLAENLDGVEEISRGRLLTPIAVGRDESMDMASITPAHVDENNQETFSEQIEHLNKAVANLSAEVSAARNDEGQLRRLMREEIHRLVDDEYLDEELMIDR